MKKIIFDPPNNTISVYNIKEKQPIFILSVNNIIIGSVIKSESLWFIALEGVYDNMGYYASRNKLMQNYLIKYPYHSFCIQPEVKI